MKRPSGYVRRLLNSKGYIIITISLLMVHLGTMPMIRDPLEQSLIAMRDRMHVQSPTNQVVIVDIDKRTVAQQPWPIPRETHAKIIQALASAGATRIGLAIDFSSRTNPISDKSLADAIAKSNIPIIIPVINDNNDEEDGQISLPIAELQKVGRLASINLTGENGRITHVPGPSRLYGNWYPSFAASISGDYNHGNYAISSNIDPTAIPRISYQDILDGHYSPTQIAGKNIIIGGTARILRDRQNIIGHDNLPSPVIIALAADTLIQGPVREKSGFIPFVIMLIIICLTVFGAPRLSARMSGFSIAIGAALIMPALIEVFFGIRFASSAALMMGFGAILGTITMGWISHNYKRRNHDLDTGLPNDRRMNDDTHSEDDRIIVMRVDNLLPIETAFGRDKIAIVMRRIHDHASMGRASEEVHLIDNSHLAWRANANTTEKEIVSEIERISDNFLTGISVGSHIFHIIITFGVAQDKTLKKALSKARHAADEAMKRGVQWEKYHEEESDSIEWKATLLGELDRSIDEKNMWVAYQPKFNADDLSLVGAEALVRWDHPTRGSIRPDTFINIAENAGRVEKLTLYVLEKAVQEISDIRRRTGKNITVAVNLSAKMIGFGRLLGPVKSILERHKLPPEALTLELTETSVIAHIASAKRELMTLRNLGINLSIDDYGTGQANLSYLEDIHANELKIDQSFILGMIESSDKRKIIESTIQLAHDLGMRVVAEGVESPAAQHLLRDMKCDHLQGYLLGRPMKPHELESLAIASNTNPNDYKDPKVVRIG